jgi:superfamily I DNA/RNA helicase
MMDIVQRCGVPLPEIAYLSFSKSAAEVIRERMNASEQDVRWFRTLHGASVKQFAMGSSIIGWRDYAAFSKETGMRVTPEEYEQDSLNFNITLHAWNLSKTTLRPLREVVRELPDHPNLAAARLGAFTEAWEAYKKRVGRFDFMDMLTKFRDEGTPLPVRRVFLDEAQDLSPLQWQVFEIMARDAEQIDMAGDDDQAIYPFIGASEYGFLDHPCDDEHVIERSWRVPEAIGARADEIIRRVAHRKQKNVIWKPEPGRVTRYNLDSVNLPWRKWQREFERIMVLCRHRKGAEKFSEGLRLSGVAHSLHGETMNTWPEAKLLHSAYSLADGKGITPRAATLLCEALGKPTDLYRAMTRREKVTEIPGVDAKSVDWLRDFSVGKRARSRFASLLRLVKHDGYEKLASDPAIVVSTMHAAKGKEADLVVIVPDCTAIVKRNIASPAEIRLAYVALTRAKREVAILVPRSDTFIHYFTGV